ncbi:MAG: NUDIX hydrolase [Candidatus Paceibacterota bacterium]
MTDKEFFDGLPKKKMGAGVFFFNNKEELLILKPNYKDHWTIPGGSVEKDESPRHAAIREVKEELNLDIPKPRFLCVDYVMEPGYKGESLQFFFYGGILSDEQIRSIKIQEEELIEYKFVKFDEVASFIGDVKKERFFTFWNIFKNGEENYSEYID